MVNVHQRRYATGSCLVASDYDSNNDYDVKYTHTAGTTFPGEYSIAVRRRDGGEIIAQTERLRGAPGPFDLAGHQQELRLENVSPQSKLELVFIRLSASGDADTPLHSFTMAGKSSRFDMNIGDRPFFAKLTFVRQD